MVKNLPASAGDLRDVGLIPGSGRSPGGGHGNPLQYSCLENSMDIGAQQATVPGVGKSQTQLNQLSTQTLVLNEVKKKKTIKALSQDLDSTYLRKAECPA